MSQMAIVFAVSDPDEEFTGTVLGSVATAMRRSREPILSNTSRGVGMACVVKQPHD